MRILNVVAVLVATVTAAAPAHAFDFGHLLHQAFGSSDPSDLGGPIFALIGVVTLLFFWIALRIGKKRQRRMIESYDDQLEDFSGRLRRGKF